MTTAPDTTTTEPDALELFGKAWLELYREAYDWETVEAQWQPGKTPVPREDTTERSQGMTSDPTPTIAADQRRLALRAAVQYSEQTLATANKILAKTRNDLRVALYAYDGRQS